MNTSIEQWYNGQTLVFGHRGASGYAPMNTLAAFELAAEQGADGIELDVWLSEDDEIVIVHDATVDHTTDGSGYVWDKPLAELKALDASNRFASTHAGVQIPTLGEVFDAVGQRLLINVEIKAHPDMRMGIEQAVADSIAQFGLEQRVIVSSFSGQVLDNFRRIMPQVGIGFLYAEDTPPSEYDIMANVVHEALHPHETMIDEAFVLRAKTDGKYVNTWTVNDANRAVQLAAWGVDAVIGDMPDMLLRALGRGG